MPQPRTMKALEKTMREQGISENIITQLNFPEAKTGDRVIALVNQMNKLLTKEQCLSVMGEHGCFKSGDMNEKSKAAGRELTGKSVAERLEIMKMRDYGWVPYMNDDGDLVFTTCTDCKDDNDMFSAPKRCACPPIRETKTPLLVSNIYCCCCAGHAKHHLQNILGVKLRLKTIGAIPNKDDELYTRIFTCEIVG
jgi:hypothetical protein